MYGGASNLPVPAQYLCSVTHIPRVQVTSYLPFFVSLNLPFSIVTGEVAVIHALVYNYFPHDLYVSKV